MKTLYKSSILVTVLLTLMMSLLSCTDNTRARLYGGTQTIEIHEYEDLMNISWKESDLWLVLRDKRTGEVYARENSSFGLLEGEIRTKKK